MTEQQTAGTVVLDTATFYKALTRLTEVGQGQDRIWQSVPDVLHTAVQDQFLTGYYRDWRLVEALNRLEAEGSDNADVLNKFLTDRGFPAAFRQIPPRGVGAAAVLDMLVEWAVKASLTRITTYDVANGYQRKQHKAFEVPKAGIVAGADAAGVELHDIPTTTGAEFYDILGSNSPLVRLLTKTGDSVWLVKTGHPGTGLNLVDFAVEAMNTKRPAVDDQYYSAAVVPHLEIDTTVDLSWMLGVNNGDLIIDQAFQFFKLRMNEKGARVKTATGLGAMRGGPRMPAPVRFDSPFAGWFTQAGSDLPIAAFYACEDVWQASDKDLEDL